MQWEDFQKVTVAPSVISSTRVETTQKGVSHRSHFFHCERARQEVPVEVEAGNLVDSVFGVLDQRQVEEQVRGRGKVLVSKDSKKKC